MLAHKKNLLATLRVKSDSIHIPKKKKIPHMRNIHVFSDMCTFTNILKSVRKRHRTIVWSTQDRGMFYKIGGFFSRSLYPQDDEALRVFQALMGLSARAYRLPRPFQCQLFCQCSSEQDGKTGVAEEELSFLSFDTSEYRTDPPI